MITKRVKTWNGFIKAIEEVRNDYAQTNIGLSEYKRNNLILFRGQSNSKWKLQTTLERASKEQFHVFDYIIGAVNQGHEIEAFTSHHWNLPSYEELQRDLKEKQDHFSTHIPAYEFLVYLRHHGYPSPLLDWTESPLIAAYFALIEAGSESAAVYCYIERPNGIKGGVGGRPKITLQDQNVRTHKRHFAQRAWYTVATKWEYKGEKHYFCSHEAVFQDQISHIRGIEQDVLIKIILPSSIRMEALRHLNDFNINHFTLFQTEESLIKALAAKRFLSLPKL